MGDLSHGLSTPSPPPEGGRVNWLPGLLLFLVNHATVPVVLAFLRQISRREGTKGQLRRGLLSVVIFLVSKLEFKCHFLPIFRRFAL